MNRNINSTNNAIFNHKTNNRPRNSLVTPETLVNKTWMQEELRMDKGVQESLMSSGVKIVELNTSSDSSKESPVNYSHAWSYVNNDRFREVDRNEYKINKEARRRRRIGRYEDDFSTLYENQFYHNRDVQSNSNAFYDNYDSADTNCTPRNHQMNCFTILNQHTKSDSSTDNENYETIEIVEIDNAEKKYWDHVYNEQVVTYDPSTQTEKRTIWIYSYKNKHLLSDNDFDLVDIDCKDTSSATSMSDEDKNVDKSTNAIRVGSPIPATYIPRLDLSLVQTLSTVTEVSEPNKQSKGRSHGTVNLKPRNNWLSERNEREKNIEKCNVVNWMALSPRERRRRSINTNLEITSKENVKETEVSHVEGSKQLDQVGLKSNKVESTEVQVDIHTNGHDEIHKGADTFTSSNEETERVISQKIADIFPMKISFADADMDIDKESKIFDFSNKPTIKIDTIVNKNKITDPIDNLECSNWISEERDEKETTTYDYDAEFIGDVNTLDSGSGNVDIDSASKRLWRKNKQLMKPPQWAEYLPITCSQPSIHLSISLNSINENQSWLRRLIKCVRCCK